MRDVYLFDWGDTLMVDFPGVPGKMCDWETVEAVDGALKALSHLSKSASIYIATGAAESSESDIQIAFKRVGLDRYITGYFCRANLGISKGEPDFLPAILDKLSADKPHVFMVGDSLVKDVEPALNAGIKAIWLNRKLDISAPKGVKVIRHLAELCI